MPHRFRLTDRRGSGSPDPDRPMPEPGTPVTPRGLDAGSQHSAHHRGLRRECYRAVTATKQAGGTMNRGITLRMQRHLRRSIAAAIVGIALLVSFPGAASAVPSSEGAGDVPLVDAGRAEFAKWVETQQLIAKERKDWQQGKEILQSRIGLVNNEITAMETKLAELQTSAHEADSRRAETSSQDETLRQTAGRLAAWAGELEGRYPPPVCASSRAGAGQIEAAPRPDPGRSGPNERFRGRTAAEHRRDPEPGQQGEQRHHPRDRGPRPLGRQAGRGADGLRRPGAGLLRERDRGRGRHRTALRRRLAVAERQRARPAASCRSWKSSRTRPSRCSCPSR